MLGHGSFSFEDLDGNDGLFVLVGRENLGFFGGDEGSSRDYVGHNSSHGFDSKGKGGGIDDHQSFGFFTFFSADDSSLNGGSIGYGFIGIDSLVGFLSVEEVSY